MAAQHHARILAGRPAVEFIGRQNETDRLLAHAHSNTGLLVLAAPGAGTSELLKQTYDRLFHEHSGAIPFYFPIRRVLGSSRDIAESFLNEFIRQLIAFRRREPTLARSASGLDELAELSLSVSGIWIDRLIQTARSAPDGRSYIRNCLAAPIRAAAHDAHSFVIIDGVHELLNIEGGGSLFAELTDIFENSGVPFVLAGHRRFLHARTDCPRFTLDNLGFEDAGRLTEVMAKENGVAISEPSRDLIATQLRGNPSLIRHLIRTASDSGISLAAFDDVEKAYADAIFDGRIGREFDDAFDAACGTPEIKRAVLSALFELQQSDTGRLDRALLQRRLRLDERSSAKLLERLNWRELVRLTPAYVEAATENLVLADHISAQERLTSPESRASIFSEALAAFIRRAPELMAKLYRAESSLGIRELLGTFGGQAVPSVLLDYDEFRELKGATPEETERSVAASRLATLPRIFFTTSAAAFYKPIAQIAESERSAIALGFGAREDVTSDVIWIAAEIDSKLEASRTLTEFWCDRLEAAAVMCDFEKFKLWLISPEGFSPDAVEVLKSRNAFGSSRRQVELLRRHLKAPAASQDLAANEYEIVIPMAEDAELVAAHAVEEIARRHNLEPRAINQIKTALVEACINASEHSLSPDRKIHQLFRIEDDRVVLTVSNRGLRLNSSVGGAEPNDGRRGWGLKLMRQLMDEVSIEQVDDGTRIVMTKMLRAA